MRKIWFALLLPCLALVHACSTDFEVYAPEQEIRAVYAVLNPLDSVQYIRIAKGYQVRGDAIAYAGANDLSLKGQQVIIRGNGVTYTAEEVSNYPKEDGIFTPTHTVYRIHTDGTGPGREKLAYNVDYTLTIGTEDAPGYVTGTTRIPEQARVQGNLNIQAGAGTTRCVPRLALEKSFTMEMKRLAADVSYEVRVYLYYENLGVPDTAMWGPSALFDDNDRCTAGSGTICYQFGDKEILNYFRTQMPYTLGQDWYTYDSKDSCVLNQTFLNDLPRSLRFECTAIDKNLAAYMRVNDPAVVDIAGTRPEFTNLTGNVLTVGVFGSVTQDSKYAILNDCSEYLLNLNGQRQPVAGCTW